jgi:hypothetical protein
MWNPLRMACALYFAPYAEQPGDHTVLRVHLSLWDALQLPFPDDVHRFISPEGLPRRGVCIRHGQFL